MKDVFEGNTAVKGKVTIPRLQHQAVMAGRKNYIVFGVRERDRACRVPINCVNSIISKV